MNENRYENPIKQTIATRIIYEIVPMLFDNPGKSMNGKINTKTPSMTIIKITSKINAPSQ